LTKPAQTNLPASVRQKLANLARKRNVDFGLILVKYGLERILFRLSRSRHRDDFILKGALLFELWTEQPYRPTRDADFLGRGDNAPERFARIFRELCVLEVVEDGLRFVAETVEAGRISEDADYEGVRVTFVAYLERAKIPIQIDIGFGEDVKTVQELMRHASSRLTLDVYAQALTPVKRAAHLKLVGLIQPAAETALGPLWSRAEDGVAVSS
jgi:hypothetical protein